ncbi:hypothetical protein L0664_07570 [Octadecabacter sp. G9-8]|uniref:DUF4240 domain-containing protein n=1 Tax=Octadecabacter dasysiphoniae TaxID=2909341 RepID=A0ABS9CUJ5_9RHOB|nr:hypothetical protein [Octadecabacter dasysiphoniae]MCF2870920.1 hypothetical protein [Octadecabacter dasysiphoniae]
MDSLNPLYKEVLEWAQTDEDIPEQDWDLALINSFSVAEFDRLIADTSIREGARSFFIGCLYTLAGDAVRTNDEELINALEAYCKEPASQNMYLKLWQTRVLKLIRNPASYEYAYWGDNPSRFVHEGGL